MAEPRLMDRMFQRIMRGLVETGRAPHYAELARALGLPTDEGRLILHDVMQAYPIGWLHPETDYIASFPPLAGVPGARRRGLHHARRARRLLRYGDAPPHAGRRLPVDVVSMARGGAARVPGIDREDHAVLVWDARRLMRI